MDVLFRRSEATAAEVMEQMPDPPSYSAVRTHLRVLEEKGFVRHEAKDLRYVYFPTIQPEQAGRHALSHLLDTFFEGSPSRLMAAILDPRSAQLPPEELDRLANMIAEARNQEESK